MTKAKKILARMYAEFNDDNFYFYNLLFYVVKEPVDDQVKGYYVIPYEKSHEKIARDAVTLLKFLHSTGDFKARKDFIAEKYKYLPDTFETDDEMRTLEGYFLRMFNQDNAFADLSAAYEIDMLNENPVVPEHIPDEVVAIFKKV